MAISDLLCEIDFSLLKCCFVFSSLLALRNGRQ